MMPASRTQRKDEGFSLIEVMVAIVILTVGLLSLAQMMVVATHSNQLSGRMTSCSALAKEQLERLKGAPFYTNPAAPPLAMVSIQVRCLGATGADQFSVIGEARFTTFRTANVG